MSRGEPTLGSLPPIVSSPAELPEDSGEPAEPAVRSAASGVQSLDRAVAILSCFSPDRPQLGLSAVARLTGLATSTTHRLLVSLARHELIRRVEERRYALGPGVLRLARVAQAAVDLREAALPIMRRLRDATGETVGLHLLRDGGRVVVDQVESHQPLRRTYTGLGERLPIHQGAPGKVLLAFLAADAQEATLRAPLEAATAHTITDPQALRAELFRIRELGYAFSMEERVEGIHTVAAPVRDHTGTVVASISVTGPASRVSHDRLEWMAHHAVSAAQHISAALGHPLIQADSPGHEAPWSRIGRGSDAKGRSMERPLIAALEDHRPQIAEDAFVAPSAVLLGRVRLGAGSSVWYGSVLRGDDDDIILGRTCNVQDGCVLHADVDFPAVLGDRVSLGHGAIVHGARIADDVLVGIRATVLNGARIGSHSLIAAGAVVTPGTEVPAGSLVAGVPGKVIREVGEREREMIARIPGSYQRKAARHRAALTDVLPTPALQQTHQGRITTW